MMDFSACFVNAVLMNRVLSLCQGNTLLMYDPLVTCHPLRDSRGVRVLIGLALMVEALLPAPRCHGNS